MFQCTGMCQPRSESLDVADGKAVFMQAEEEADRIIAAQRRLVEEEQGCPQQDQMAQEKQADVVLPYPAPSKRHVEASSTPSQKTEDSCSDSNIPRSESAEERRKREKYDKVTQQLLEAQRTVEKKALVRDFLRDEGFDNVNDSRRHKYFFRTTYPLHVAAKAGNARLVELLIAEGADKTKQDYRGRTPAMIARARDLHGSHAAVLQALGEKASEKLSADAPQSDRQTKASAGGA